LEKSRTGLEVKTFFPLPLPPFGLTVPARAIPMVAIYWASFVPDVPLDFGTSSSFFKGRLDAPCFSSFVPFVVEIVLQDSSERQCVAFFQP